MKLKNLKVHNIASIEDAELNFEQEPLESARLFLICGDMGSGKSTLLDAVCLALFDQTPRLKNAADDKNQYGADAVTPRDSRNLMRRGTYDSSAILVFEADDGKTYEAKWSCTRTKSYRYNQVERSLKSDEVTIEGKTEVKNMILKILGLDFDQFCRTSMLAQGQFTQFLKSKENEKAGLLEKMTRTTCFSEIGKAVYGRFSKVDNDLKNAKAVASGFQLMNPEEKEQKMKQVEEDGKSLKNLEVTCKTAQDKYAWAKREQECLEAKNKAEQQWKSCRDAVNDPAFLREESLIADWDNSAEARITLSQLKQQNAILQTIANSKEPNARGIYAKLVKSLKLFETQIKDNEKTLSHCKILLEKERANVPVYDHIQTVKIKLEDVLKNRNENKRDSMHCEKLKSAIPTLTQNVQSAKDHMDDCDKSLALLKENIQVEAEKLKELKPEVLSQEQSHVDSLVSQVNAAKDAVNQLENVLLERRKAEEALATCKKKAAEEQKKLSQSMPVQAERQRVYAAAQKSCQEAALAIGDEVERLRAQLNPGDQCPVCGKTIETILTSSAAHQIFDSLQEDMKRKEEDLREIMAKVDASNNLIASCEKDLPTLESEKTKWERQTQRSFEELERVCQLLAISLDADLSNVVPNVRELLKIKEEDLAKTKTQLKERQCKVDEQNRVINTLKGQENEAIDKRGKAALAHSNAQGELQTQKQQIAYDSSLIASRDEKIETWLGEVDSLMPAASWKINFEEDGPGFIQDYEQKARDYNDLTKKITNLEHSIDKNNRQLQNMNRNRDDVSQKWPDWDEMDLAAVAANECSNLEKEWSDFATKANTLYGGKINAQNEIETLNSKLADFYMDHPNIPESRLIELSAFLDMAMKGMKGVHQQKNDALKGAASVLETQRQAYDDHLKVEHPTLNEEDSLSALEEANRALNEQYQDLRDKVSGIKALLEKDDTDQKAYQKQLDKLKDLEKLYNKWSALNDVFGGKDGGKFRNIAQTYLLSNLLKRANDYLNDLDKRYSLECIPDTLTMSLRDRYQPDMVSPVDALSGGESFLVSLSLALALASMNRQGLSIDTLFIDEGFATVSDRELDAVINLLERLQERNGKRVGIISHVKDLRERIPVHVEVKRIDPTRSGIKVKDVTAASC